jgi:hypothetical protein
MCCGVYSGREREKSKKTEDGNGGTPTRTWARTPEQAERVKRKS